MTPDARPPSDETPATGEPLSEGGFRYSDRSKILCRTCMSPLSWETRTEPGYLPRVGWYDDSRVEPLVCWSSVDYRHKPLSDREWAYYEAGQKSVVDPAEAREKIARALHQHDEVLRHIPWDGLLSDERAMYLAAADAAIAALTTQEPTTEPPPRVEDIVDGWVKPGGGPT